MITYDAYQVSQAGGPDVLKRVTLNLPTAKPGWVVVQITAFGLNRSEMFTRQGHSPNVIFPRVLGIECVGVIKDSVDQEFKVGQTVVALMGGMGRDFDGGYAQFALLPKQILHPIETSLPAATVGALPEMFQTSWGSLFAGLDIKSANTLLIRGATSSVGRMALQLAKGEGLYVIATTRSENKKAGLLNAGADFVLIDDGDLSSKLATMSLPAVDRVLELVGTTTLRDSLSCCRQGGIVCMSGILGNAWTLEEFSPMDEIPHTTRLTIYTGGPKDFDRFAFEQYLSSIAQAKLTAPIDRIFNFDQLIEAHEYMESNQASGKLVVVV